MLILPLQTLSEYIREGVVCEVSDFMGWHYVRNGWATQEPEPPTVSIEDRLNAGAGETCLFLPFIGEFGHLIMSHMRIVHFNRAYRKIVCCRPGQEILFPLADEFVTDWVDPLIDKRKIGTRHRLELDWSHITARFPDAVPLEASPMTREQELQGVRLSERIPLRPKLRGLRADVVIGPRKREFAPDKNWKHWPIVAEAIHRSGYTLAVIGDRATSFDLPHQVCHTGDLDTDAAVELLQNCRLYLGTDSGASHLAAAVGAKMLVTRTDGSFNRDLRPRMAEANPGPDPRRWYSQHEEDRWISDNIPLPQDGGFFVEVGASDGTDGSNTLHFERDCGWKGLLIEPNPSEFAKLGFRKCLVDYRAAGVTPGTADFTIHPTACLSGLSRPHTPAIGTRSIPVRVETLTQILRERGAPPTIDLLSIDTEGTELDVWAGLDLKIFRPMIVIVEFDTAGIRRDPIGVAARLGQDGYLLRHTTKSNQIFTWTGYNSDGRNRMAKPSSRNVVSLPEGSWDRPDRMICTALDLLSME